MAIAASLSPVPTTGSSKLIPLVSFWHVLMSTELHDKVDIYVMVLDTFQVFDTAWDVASHLAACWSSFISMSAHVKLSL